MAFPYLAFGVSLTVLNKNYEQLTSFTF